LNFSSAREIINFWFGVDLLLQSRFSFRLGLFILNYSQSGDTYYSFAESKFITPEPVQLLDWGVFAQTSYLFFGPRFFAEAGVGVNTIFGNGFTGIINIPGQRRFEPKGIIGLRYQSILGGFCFGAGYTPYIDLNGFQNHMSLSAGFAL
jgi:hypothetical protein